MLRRSQSKNTTNMFIVSLDYKMENDVKRNTTICLTESQFKKIQFKTIILYDNGIYGRAEINSFISHQYDKQLLNFTNVNKKFIFNSIDTDLIDDVNSEMLSSESVDKNHETANILLSILYNDINKTN